ncbi:hypothetical protein A9179_06755 [Pseudomonas alcaligenes]|uniref:Zinc ribbon domain-containing protein n=1 Tax=Aquipseudomonas alcaligenes TaxID=43263 RepID=A0ABR7RZ20_AQUAC|nr:hypothetical protein [Pseudomonas alcaligenes]MBC9249974.1 hypothetical protein [Pseudomonas alcaligenes]
MKICDQCEAPVPTHGTLCPHCGGLLMRVPEVAGAARPSRLFKVLKWLCITLALLALLAVGTVLLILNSLGPMPSFG